MLCFIDTLFGNTIILVILNRYQGNRSSEYYNLSYLRPQGIGHLKGRDISNIVDLGVVFGV